MRKGEEIDSPAQDKDDADEDKETGGQKPEGGTAVKDEENTHKEGRTDEEGEDEADFKRRIDIGDEVVAQSPEDGWFYRGEFLLLMSTGTDTNNNNNYHIK